MTFLPSASKLDLASACSFAWAPQAGGWPKQDMSPAAAFGSAVHKAAEMSGKCTFACGDEPPVTGHVFAEDFRKIADSFELGETDYRKFMICAAHVSAWCTEEDVDEDRGDAVERAYAFNVSTGEGRAMRRADHRDYSDQRPGELVGTADLITLDDESGRLVVSDWKTGKGDIAERPRDHLQMLFLGLAAARAHGVNSVRIRYLLVSEEGITPVHDDLDEFALSAIAVRLRKLVATLGQTVPKPGPHCYSKYCPIVATCPATKAALVAIDTASALEHPLSVDITSPEHAASVRVRLKMVCRAPGHQHLQGDHWILERAGRAARALQGAATGSECGRCHRDRAKGVRQRDRPNPHRRRQGLRLQAGAIRRALGHRHPRRICRARGPPRAGGRGPGGHVGRYEGLDPQGHEGSGRRERVAGTTARPRGIPHAEAV